VLSGHIHRAQQLTHAIDRQPLPAPVIYPGSIERTSFAERFESKYYVILKIELSSPIPHLEVEYRPLPSRPMIKLKIPTGGAKPEAIKTHLHQTLSNLDPDAIVRLQFTGPNAETIQASLSASDLRALAPQTMNISLPIQWRSERQRAN
jgi:DNA repair exonuclease SbcCD nuclease subunit